MKENVFINRFSDFAFKTIAKPPFFIVIISTLIVNDISLYLSLFKYLYFE